MKTNVIAVAGIGLLVLFAAGFAGIFEIRLASAQVDATSSPSIDTPLSTTTPDSDVAATSTIAEVVATSTDTAVATSQATSTPPKEAPTVGLTKVHIIGTKYIDYFTDGTTTFAFPGDPAIDSHFNVPNAQIPTHEGLTWVHTTGQHLYDTPSGNLEVGEYAAQADNSYIENAPPFVSSTSTPAELPASATNGSATDTPSTTSSVASSSAPDASATVPGPSDNFASTSVQSELDVSASTRQRSPSRRRATNPRTQHEQSRATVGQASASKVTNLLL